MGPGPSPPSARGMAGPGSSVAEWAPGRVLTLAIEMVCCSMASWIATRSSSRICVEERNVHQPQVRGLGCSGNRTPYRSYCS